MKNRFSSLVVISFLVSSVAFADGTDTPTQTRSDTDTHDLKLELREGNIPNPTPFTARIQAGRYQQNVDGQDGHTSGNSIEAEGHVYYSAYKSSGDNEGNASVGVLDLGARLRLDSTKSFGDPERIEFESPGIAITRLRTGDHDSHTEKGDLPDGTYGDKSVRDDYVTGDIVIGSARFVHRKNDALDTQTTGAELGLFSGSFHAAAVLNETVPVDLCAKVDLFKVNLGENRTREHESVANLRILDASLCAGIQLGMFQVRDTFGVGYTFAGYSEEAEGDFGVASRFSLKNRLSAQVNLGNIKGDVGYSVEIDKADDGVASGNVMTQMLSVGVAY